MQISEILDLIAPQIPADARRELFITLAEQQIDNKAWGKLYNQGVANLVAHQMTLNPVGGSTGLATGAIKLKKAGDEMIEYAQSSSQTSGSLGSTTYGQAFLALQSRVVSGFDWSNRP